MNSIHVYGDTNGDTRRRHTMSMVYQMLVLAWWISDLLVCNGIRLKTHIVIFKFRDQDENMPKI